MDGGDPFSDENTGSCQYRNELACTRVQSQTGDENTGDSSIDAGNEGMRRALVLKSRLYQTLNSRF
jgi:hypothetical protein